MKYLVLVAMVFPAFSMAATLNGIWHFKRSDGAVGMVKIFGDYPSCTVYPAGKDINILINVGTTSLQAPSCYSDVSPDSAIKVTLTYEGGQLANGAIYFGKDFNDLMDSYRRFGSNVVGPIGNSDRFPCSAAATAFLIIDGFVVGDPNGNIVGYCLNP